MNYLKGSALALISILAMGAVMAPAPNESGSIDFGVTIQKDASISISSVCTNDSATSLSFTPGITLINETEALPSNECASAETSGHWTISNVGNIDLELKMQLYADLPSGVTTSVGDAYTYGASDYISVIYASQTNWPDTITKTNSVNFYQRVAADATALGGDTDSNTIVITSLPDTP
ncbi:MAG: hypothetical protein WC307_04900 [Candidatus Nanoarchaeia archaeon]|jgi:hypothetical protein